MAGLNSISSLISAVESVENNMVGGVYIKKAVQENVKKIVELNVGQLNDHGVNSVGVSIDTYAPYTPYTISIKKEKGQPTDRVTLRDTGDFHKSFYVVVGPTGFYITASDYKTEGLIDKYGAEIFGLTPENKTNLVQGYLYPIVLNEVRKEIFS